MTKEAFLAVAISLASVTVAAPAQAAPCNAKCVAKLRTSLSETRGKLVGARRDADHWHAEDTRDAADLASTARNLEVAKAALAQSQDSLARANSQMVEISAKLGTAAVDLRAMTGLRDAAVSDRAAAETARDEALAGQAQAQAAVGSNVTTEIAALSPGQVWLLLANVKSRFDANSADAFHASYYQSTGYQSYSFDAY
ncbi:MAG: hypothetical protein H0X39_17370 [Actinobacteria bacterium]|nr:hypothetical protein [Actinomycetota bacterium]